MTSSLRILKLFTDHPYEHTGTQLRGALLARFPDRERLHNHADGPHRPAVVRFVVEEGAPCVVAFGPGRRELLDIYEQLETLPTRRRTYRITGRELHEAPLELALSDALHTYRSASPWLALNQSNHRRYLHASDPDARRQLLERILRGNFLTAAADMGHRFPAQPRVMVRIHRFESRPERISGQDFLAFRVVLTTNVRWSSWVGIGKMASKGFGRLREV